MPAVVRITDIAPLSMVEEYRKSIRACHKHFRDGVIDYYQIDIKKKQKNILRLISTPSVNIESLMEEFKEEQESKL